MANHEAKVIGVYRVNNGEVVVHIRCCDDPTTESRHTFNSMKIPIEQVNKEIAEHCVHTAKQHETVMNHLQTLATVHGVSGPPPDECPTCKGVGRVQLPESK